MTSREKFEAWMTDEQWFNGSDFEWDERRNCYAQFGIHLAYKAFLAAEGAAEQKLTDMAVQLANAESKCRELAAESAGMKQLASEAYDEMVSHHDTDGLYSLDADGEQMDALIRLCDAQATIYDTLVMCDTPATDAFLAEVQAQGVEMFADSLKVVGGHEHPYSVVANEFAAQLRKGGAA